ncbi:hypothetical protein KUCAC02_020648 [Chaenocephalus aceratus]|uniref:Uncharacterized protein n=1 Tax=Chaenocephalus aceratus TaxID=36190 RepID=A0ACB9XE22_CHAAC|nr:hypothetical protein KUCAC02_020648 [Chaenocephalus aceratus]
MPGKLKAKIVAGRHLPVMDRASDLTDAFVEVKFGNTTFKTDVCPKSLNPQWNSEWFKFEVDDEDLQDEPLQVTVLDHDTYSANDAIGKVYIDIDPLLCSEAASVISGWFPIYDTIHVELFNDLNRFRQSSCGVKFFCTSSIPRCYKAAMVHGFVEELVVNEDPEYQWIDRIRTPRASNEARQRLISLMSGELQRKIGLKVLEMGGNAVVGYLQCFDLEGESGLVVRAIGTACTLDKLSSGSAPNSNTHMHPNTAPPSNACNSPSKDGKESPLAHGCRSTHNSPVHSACSSQRLSQNFSVSVPTLIFTVKPVRSRPGIFLCPSSPTLFTDTLSLSGSGSVICGHNSAHRASTPPPPFSVHSDTVLLRKSVSFTEDLLLAASGMGNGGSAGKEAGPLKTLLRQQTQTALEQRMSQEDSRRLVGGGYRQEIKSHAQSSWLPCCGGEEGCILSASGTAAILNPRYMREGASTSFEELSPPSCGFCHIPYDELNMPFPAQLTYCYQFLMCSSQQLNLPPEAAVTGKGCLIQARLCRLKKKAQGEVNATAISNLLPFMEYELHTQLMNKLKLRSMNALFGLHIQISVGENMLLGLAECTLTSPAGSRGHPEIAGKTPGADKRRLLVLRFLSPGNDPDFSAPTQKAQMKQLMTLDAVADIHSLLMDASTPPAEFLLQVALNDPCCLCKLNFTVAVPEEELIQVAVTAVPMTFDKDQKSGEAGRQAPHQKEEVRLKSSCSSPWSYVQTQQQATPSKHPKPQRCSPLPEGRSRSLRSTRSFGAEGGVSGFLHSFIAEVFAMVRAHVAALGGNAVVSYSMKECMLMENPNKNQAQCLINVSGDAVICVRETDPEPTPSTTNIGQICPSGTDVTT